MSRQLGGSSTLRRNVRGPGGHNAIEQSAVYEYALRCAILAASEDARNAAAAEAISQRQKEKQEKHATINDVIGSLTDLFGDDGKPNKLTKEVCKGLNKRIDDIIKRRDTSNPAYQDQHLINALTQFQTPLMQSQKSKPTGTINDLLLIFIKTSEHELRRAYPPPQTTGDRLNAHLAVFAGLLKETIIHDAPQSASAELVRALEGFTLSSPKTARSDPGPSQRRANAQTGPTFFENTPLVKTVKDLFQVPQEQHREMVRRLQNVCTEQVRIWILMNALLVDIKKCINNVNTKASFPASPNDFPTPQAYDNWKKREVNQLQGLIKSVMAGNPQISLTSTETEVGSLLSGSRPQSMAMNRMPSDNGSDYRASYSPSMSSTEMQDAFGRFEQERAGSPGGTIGTPTMPNPWHPKPGETSFTFIPPDPKGYYRVLLSKCIDHDISIESSEERTKATVLSKSSEEVLKECFLRWRLSSPYRAVLYLDLVKQKYDAEQLSFEDLKDAMRTFDNKSFKELDLADWTINDVSVLTIS
ncbi:hypothetical protein BC938DRAFT_473438 [Jimgerdemannia flammicorona]|uniref:Uncharacterized protein n=1 Tax=Jimgerdemannia flammicorona TaxID=994334 RepID=A0A433Q3Z0_9FUNG|nr:hypothetical protein BC938DRAFT_473438 [Jimgerdemannia flammicorona]